MKHRIKVVKEEKGFVGYLLQDEQITFMTEPFQTSIEASRALTNFINSKQAKKATPTTPVRSPISRPTQTYAPAPPTISRGRSCCGRS